MTEFCGFRYKNVGGKWSGWTPVVPLSRVADLFKAEPLTTYITIRGKTSVNGGDQVRQWRRGG